jgi:hypothetical protein
VLHRVAECCAVWLSVLCVAECCTVWLGVRDFRRLWVELSKTFRNGKHYNQRLDRPCFADIIFFPNVNNMCLCQAIQRYKHVVWVVLKPAEHNIINATEDETCFGILSYRQAITYGIKRDLTQQYERQPPTS